MVAHCSMSFEGREGDAREKTKIPAQAVKPIRVLSQTIKAAKLDSREQPGALTEHFITAGDCRICPR